MYKFCFLSLDRADYSVVTAVVFNDLRYKTDIFKNFAYSLSLFFTDFDRKKTSDRKHFHPQRYKSAVEVQSVFTAEQSKFGLESYFLLQNFHIRRRNIGRI